MPDVALSRILRLVGARSLNTFGRAVISATVLWELYIRTDSKLVIAGVGLVQVIPVFVLFVPAGTLVDRSDRRTVPAIVGGGVLAILVVGFVAVKWRALAAMPPLAELGAGADPTWST